MIARDDAHGRDMSYSPDDRVLLSARNLNIPGPSTLTNGFIPIGVRGWQNCSGTAITSFRLI